MSVDGHLEKTSERGDCGKTFAENFETANYHICDAASFPGREEENETFNTIKMPETSGGCWHECLPLWHQATILLSNPNGLASRLSSELFSKQKVQKAIKNSPVCLKSLKIRAGDFPITIEHYPQIFSNLSKPLEE